MSRAALSFTRSTAGSPLRTAVAGSLAGKAVEMVTLVALATVVPRVLGPDEYGRFSVPLTIVTIGSLAMTLGGPAVLARYVPTVAPGRRPALAMAIGLRLARGRGVQIVGVAVVAVVLALAAPSWFPPGVTALVVAALAVNVAAQLCLQVGLGLGRTGAWSLRYPLHNAVLVVAVLALDAVAGSIGTIVGILVAAVATLLLGVWVVAPVVRARVIDETAAVPDGAIRFGIYQASGAALTQFAQRGGVLAAALLAGSTTETGYASLAIGVALGATYAVLQTYTVTLPHLVGEAREDSEAPLRRLSAGLLAVIIPCAVAGVVVLDRVVPVVFGDAYEPAVSAFVPAAAAVVLAPIGALAVQVTALRLRPEVALWCGLAAAVGFVMTALVATPAWGASGAVTATLVGMCSSVTVAAVTLRGALTPALVGTSAAGVVAVLAAGTWLA